MSIRFKRFMASFLVVTTLLFGFDCQRKEAKADVLALTGAGLVFGTALIPYILVGAAVAGTAYLTVKTVDNLYTRHKANQAFNSMSQAEKDEYNRISQEYVAQASGGTLNISADRLKKAGLDKFVKSLRTNDMGMEKTITEYTYHPLNYSDLDRSQDLMNKIVQLSSTKSKTPYLAINLNRSTTYAHFNFNNTSPKPFDLYVNQLSGVKIEANSQFVCKTVLTLKDVYTNQSYTFNFLSFKHHDKLIMTDMFFNKWQQWYVRYDPTADDFISNSNATLVSYLGLSLPEFDKLLRDYPCAGDGSICYYPPLTIPNDKTLDFPKSLDIPVDGTIDQKPTIPLPIPDALPKDTISIPLDNPTDTPTDTPTDNSTDKPSTWTGKLWDFLQKILDAIKSIPDFLIKILDAIKSIPNILSDILDWIKDIPSKISAELERLFVPTLSLTDLIKWDKLKENDFTKIIDVFTAPFANMASQKWAGVHITLFKGTENEIDLFFNPCDNELWEFVYNIYISIGSVWVYYELFYFYKRRFTVQTVSD